jgi:hypothetical protein
MTGLTNRTKAGERSLLQAGVHLLTLERIAVTSVYLCTNPSGVKAKKRKGKGKERNGRLGGRNLLYKPRASPTHFSSSKLNAATEIKRRRFRSSLNSKLKQLARTKIDTKKRGKKKLFGFSSIICVSRCIQTYFHLEAFKH